MFRKLFLVTLLVFATFASATAQKKEMAQAKAAIKAGKAAEAEASMRTLLANPDNRSNEKIWLVLFDAVKKQYEDVNEQMYLKQSTDTAKLFEAAYRMFGVLEGLDSVDAQPNENGRVQLKYRRKNAEYLDAYRKNLYTGGSFFLNKQNYQRAFTLFSAYIDCAEQPLFQSYDYTTKDKRLPSAAFYALYSGYRANDPVATLRYKDLAEADTARLQLTLQYVADTSVVTPHKHSRFATVRLPSTQRAKLQCSPRAQCCSPCNATTSAYSSAMLSSPSTTALQMLISTLAWLTSIRR